jgi:hypothetical protein
VGHGWSLAGVAGDRNASQGTVIAATIRP